MEYPTDFLEDQIFPEIKLRIQGAWDLHSG